MAFYRLYPGMLMSLDPAKRTVLLLYDEATACPRPVKACHKWQSVGRDFLYLGSSALQLQACSAAASTSGVSPS
jgi:hypothetical protein